MAAVDEKLRELLIIKLIEKIIRNLLLEKLSGEHFTREDVDGL